MTTPTIKTHEPDQPAGPSSGICGICQRQISRYTCPSCNLSYCSLKCFRSEHHSTCSETFYRKEIETGIKSDSSKTEGDRNKILELLKRMETVDEDEIFLQSDEEIEGESFASRFSAVDISAASADDLLQLLTKEERDKFFAGLRDPSSGLIRELLESTELHKSRQLPWWDAPSDDGQSSLPLHTSYGTKPELIPVPTNLVNHASRGVSLSYNIVAVFLAYAYATRHLATSPLSSRTNDAQDQCEARKIISQSVPFLVDRKSKVLYVSMGNAVLSVWSRLEPGSIDNKIIPVLLEDVAKLLRPRRVTFASEGREREGVLTADHPLATTITALSDLSSLFSNPVDSRVVVHQKSHVEMKLIYYAAHILSTPPSELHVLADRVLILSENLGKEAH